MKATEPELFGARAVKPSVDGVDMRRVSLLSAGHLVNDMYGNLATSLAPYLVLRGRLSAPAAGALILAYLAGSSVLQPVFGLLSDRHGRRWFAAAGPVTVGIAMCLLDVAPNDWILYGLVGLGGIGTAMFHPEAASMVNHLVTRSRDKSSRGWCMSIFSMGGNLGYAIGPLLAAALSDASVGWSIAAMVPGVGLTSLIYRFAPSTGSRLPHRGDQTTSQAIRSGTRSLVLIVLVIAIRSGVLLSAIFLLPLYFNAHHLAAGLGSLASSVLLLTGAMGGLYGGRLSDRVGRKPVVTWSLAAAAPLLVVAAFVPITFIWPVLALAGAALLASNSVTVVQAQELIPNNAGMAAGLTLGLGFGLSGIITFFISTVTKGLGPQGAFIVLAVLPLAAAILIVPVRSTQAA